MTGKLPEGRKPLPDEWFIDRANKLGPGKTITPMTQEERDRAKVRSRINRTEESKEMVSTRFPYPLTMNDYQADAAQFAIYKWRVVYPALGLANEAGEVLGKIKKLIRDHDLTFGPNQKLSDKDRAAIADELGDVLWYVAVLSRDLGISLNEVAHINTEKLTSRQKRGVIGGSGDNR